MRNRRDAILLTVLVVLVVVLALVAGSRDDGKGGMLDARPSTYLTGQNGAKALRDVLVRLEVPTGRRTRPFDDPGPIAGPVAVLAPSVPLSDGEAHALAAWVRGGGTLIYAARRMDGLRDTLGLRLQTLASDSMFAEFDYQGARASAAALPVTEGVAFVDGFRRGFAAGSPALVHATVLASAGVLPVVIDYRLGKGRVIAWADALPLVNGRLKTSRAAILFARTAVDAGQGRRIWFDEYHHGFKTGGSLTGTVGRWLVHDAAGRAVLQGVAVVLGLLLLFGRRFGAPLPPPPARRRSPLEHMEALAGAYRQAKAHDTARRLVIAGLARRLGRRVPPTGDAERELLQRLAAHPTAGAAARRVEMEWKKGRGADLVALSRDVDRYLHEVSRS